MKQNKITFMVGPHEIGRYGNEVSRLYSTKEVKFALAKRIKSNSFKNISALIGCRDLLMNCIREDVLRLDDIDFGKTELVFYKHVDKGAKRPLRDRVESAVRLLNTLEKANKWKRTCGFEIDKAVSQNEGDRVHEPFSKYNTVYIVGSKMWINNMYFMYMYVLLIRAFLDDDTGYLKDADTLPKFIKAVIKTTDDNGDPITSTISYTQGLNHWETVFKNRRKLFRGFKPLSTYGSPMEPDGIYRLTSCSCGFGVLNRRMSKLIE